MLHEPHMGVVKSKAMARSYVWWPGLDEAVEQMCRSCEVCAAHADAPPRQTPTMWPWPNRPWSILHLDFMGPIFGKTYLIVVDAMSKWMEIFHMAGTTGAALVDKLCELFSRWGLPKQIVTDNGPQFTCTELRNFVNGNGIDHIYSAPYHPSSNGLAENAVRSLKRVIKKAVQAKENVNRALCTYLLHYRNTAHSTTGESPAMLLLGRRLRTRLDVLKPDRERFVYKAQLRQKDAAKGGRRLFEQEEEVWYRQYLSGDKWVPGRISECLGPNNYKVKGSKGEEVHRHVDQLRRKASGLSLACPAARVNESIQAELGSGVNSEPSALSSEQGRVDDTSIIQSPLRSPSVTQLPQSREGEHTSTPTSPEFHDALPDVPTQVPRQRPMRKCRIENAPNYKT